MINLRNELMRCKECPLFKELMCFPNIGCGSTKPDIMFIIGGVDRENLIFDKPFSDISETVLLKCLNKTGISPNRCYCTSIIKCGTLKDNKSYIETCSKWLIKEIDELKPKVLFFIGQKTFDIFFKLYGDIGIKTLTEPQTLHGIFNKNSCMSAFIERLKEADDLCKRFSVGN